MSKKLFDWDYIVTRPFGFKDGYYTQFGFLGHEGCDFVPNSSIQSGANVYSVCDGEVVRDTDDISQDPNWGAYGKKVIIWNKEKKIAFWYCHLQSNSVKIGQLVKEGDLIGKMGNTTSTKEVFGAHLHLDMCNTDDQGSRINQDNGYKGFIDPLPFVMQGSDQPSSVSVPSATFTELVNKSTKYDEFDKIGFKSSQDVTNKIATLNQTIEDTSRDRDEWKRKSEHFEDFLGDVAKELNCPVDEANIIKVINGLVSGEVGCQEVKEELLKASAEVAKLSNKVDEQTKRILDATSENQRLSKSLQEATGTLEKERQARQKLQTQIEEWNKRKDEILIGVKNFFGIIIKVFKRNGGE